MSLQSTTNTHTTSRFAASDRLAAFRCFCCTCLFAAAGTRMGKKVVTLPSNKRSPVGGAPATASDILVAMKFPTTTGCTRRTSGGATARPTSQRSRPSTPHSAYAAREGARAVERDLADAQAALQRRAVDSGTAASSGNAAAVRARLQRLRGEREAVHKSFRAAAPLQDEIELLERCEALVARAEELASHLAAARNSVAQLRRGERMNGAPADIPQ